MREVSSLPTREATATTAAPSVPTAAPSVPAGGPVATASVRAFITGYSYFDNTPPGSTQVSHPVLHAVAGGRGTYDDPITVAVGHVREGDVDLLDWPAGTRFYVPNLRRYLIVEDTCGDGERPQEGPCHTGYPAGATTWLDVWVGEEGGTTRGAERCMQKITGVWDVIVDPDPGFAVDPGDIYAPADAGSSDTTATGCTDTYGDEISRVG
ncbi:MAG: hypothetical protein IRY85_02950 [Micromonosporaceae bacterium]|nr:hypothetical protein [Micromonosporaceae bacterium]